MDKMLCDVDEYIIHPLTEQDRLKSYYFETNDQYCESESDETDSILSL